jgi:hypothetical protein
MLCKRTDDPKLSWLESRLDAAHIPHRRNGFSFHAPILEVASERLEQAWKILTPVDDIPDDDEVFVEDVGGCSCSAAGPGDSAADALCAFCLSDAAVEEASR